MSEKALTFSPLPKTFFVSFTELHIFYRQSSVNDFVTSECADGIKEQTYGSFCVVE